MNTNIPDGTNIYIMNQDDTDGDEMRIADILKTILLQWRAILAFAIVVAIVTGAVCYVRDRRELETQKAYMAMLKNNSKSEVTKIISANLSEDELEDVDDAYIQKRRLDNLQTYVDNSIYMKVDAMSCETLDLLYYITAQKDEATILRAAYTQMLQEDSSVEKIRKASGVKAASKYIRELIDVSDGNAPGTSVVAGSSNDTMKISFILPPKADAKAVEKAINNLVMNYDASQYGISRGSVRKVSSYVNFKTDDNMKSRQDNYAGSLKNQKDSYKTVFDALSADQKTLLNLKLYGRAYLNQDGLSVVSASKKYMAIAFVATVFIYFVLFLVMVVLRKKAAPASGGGDEELGRLLDDEKKHGNAFFCDKKLLRRFYSQERDTAKMSRVISSQMRINSGKENLEAVELWAVGFDDTHSKVLAALTDETNSQGITTQTVSTQKGSPEAMVASATRGKSIVLLINDYVTLKKDVKYIKNMLYKMNCDYIGYVEII